MTQPLVSIAMATFNGEKFLRSQIDSIYSQTYKNIEVVVTDDCSQDKTTEILQDYKLKRGLKYFVNNERLGLVRNFEKAISSCYGEYIALCDQDDIWKPEKLEILVREIGEYSLIYSLTCEYINEGGFPVRMPGCEDFCLRLSTFGTGNPTQRLIAYNWLASHQILFKRELLKFCLPIPDSQNFHDAWLAIVASKLNGIKFITNSLIYYRRHEGSITYPLYSLKQPLPMRLYGFIHRIKNDRAKKEGIQNETRRLTDMLAFPLLNDSDRNFILELITYYQNRLNSKIHIRSFLTAIKLADNFFYNTGTMQKVKFALSALIA